jgi:hypothetical protein
MTIGHFAFHSRFALCTLNFRTCTHILIAPNNFPLFFVLLLLLRAMTKNGFSQIDLIIAQVIKRENSKLFVFYPRRGRETFYLCCWGHKENLPALLLLQ